MRQSVEVDHQKTNMLLKQITTSFIDIFEIEDEPSKLFTELANEDNATAIIILVVRNDDKSYSMNNNRIDIKKAIQLLEHYSDKLVQNYMIAEITNDIDIAYNVQKQQIDKDMKRFQEHREEESKP